MTERELKKNLLDELYSPFSSLDKIPLDTSGATKVIFGVGDPNAKLMIIGEAPGRQEDLKGEPFIGRSGQLLTQTLHKFGIHRNEIYITNTVKCRPPNNRTPLPQEIEFYKKLLLEPEIKIIRPKVILVVGAVALSALLDSVGKISQVRGKEFLKNNTIIIPTYHPAYILRNPDALTYFEKDIQFAISKLDHQKPPK